MANLQTSPLSLPAAANRNGNATGVIGGLFNESLVSELAPRYSHAAKLGKVFAGRGALQTLSVAGTAMTGLIIWNSSSPTSGGVDLHLLKLSGNVAVTSATTTGIAVAYLKTQTAAPTTTTAATQTCTYLGGSLGSGLAYTVATVAAAPTAFFDVLHNTAAIGTTGEDPGFLIDLEGSVIVPPQSLVCFVALGAASAASAVNLSALWAELPA